MAIITTSELREYVDVDIPETGLELLINQIDAVVVKYAGIHSGSLDVVLKPAPSMTDLYLKRGQQSISAITVGYARDSISKVLTAADYYAKSASVIERVTAPYVWEPFVRVQYTVSDEDYLRKMTAIDLCKLAIDYSGRERVEAGVDVELWYRDIQKERELLLRWLAPVRSFSST